jgi:hypothetical protein
MDRVRKIEESLPAAESFFWLVSLDDPMRGRVGGRVVSVSRADAARLIEDGAYRLATNAEAAAHEAGQTQAREEARHVAMNPARRYSGRCVVLAPRGKTQK